MKTLNTLIYKVSRNTQKQKWSIGNYDAFLENTSPIGLTATIYFKGQKIAQWN